MTGRMRNAQADMGRYFFADALISPLCTWDGLDGLVIMKEKYAVKCKQEGHDGSESLT